MATPTPSSDTSAASLFICVFIERTLQTSPSLPPDEFDRKSSLSFQGSLGCTEAEPVEDYGSWDIHPVHFGDLLIMRKCYSPPANYEVLSTRWPIGWTWVNRSTLPNYLLFSGGNQTIKRNPSMSLSYHYLLFFVISAPSLRFFPLEKRITHQERTVWSTWTNLSTYILRSQGQDCILRDLVPIWLPSTGAPTILSCYRWPSSFGGFFLGRSCRWRWWRTEGVLILWKHPVTLFLNLQWKSKGVDGLLLCLLNRIPGFLSCSGVWR